MIFVEDEIIVIVISGKFDRQIICEVSCDLEKIKDFYERMMAYVSVRNRYVS